MDKLLKGFEEFRKETYEGQDALMPQLVAKGQKPDFFIISCVDSRSNPGTIFKPKPGTFFAHKSMGAIVRPYKKGTALSAALQFAINHNGVKKIILLGHSGCGAVKALIEDIDDPEISSFISVAKHALAKAQTCCSGHAEILGMTEKEIVLESTENLKSYPSVKDALSEGRLIIKPWFFDMKQGTILEYQEDKKKFIPITKETDKAA